MLTRLSALFKKTAHRGCIRTSRNKALSLRAPLSFALAAGLTFLVAATALAVVFDRLQHAGTDARPSNGERSGYAVSITTLGSPAHRQPITASGGGCEALLPSALLRESCELATYLDTAFIGASAKGRLNVDHGPATEAVIWRAWLQNRLEACAEGGLLSAPLATCRAAVARSTYSVTDSGVTLSFGPR